MNTDFSIRTRSLNYFFGQEQILKSLNLEVRKGTIHGFLGPNGAGKTTTIRLLLGLLKTRENEVFVFDKDITSDRKSILKQVGALVEMPSLYPHLTAKENLEVTRRWMPWVEKDRIGEVLHIVGLTDSAEKKVSKFSLGMKQRLGLALALLPDPELLILDEPTNGLDPSGILEIRRLLLKLNQKFGKTIFVSSHLLSEVEKIASHLSIIHQGELRFQGSIEELKSVYTKNKVYIKTNSPKVAQNILRGRGLTASLSASDELVISEASEHTIHIANSSLIASGLEVYQISTKASDLEDLFMGITGDRLKEVA